MPILLKLTYRDINGKVLNEVGPEELYLPKLNSLAGVNSKVVLDLLEEELEEYNWSRLEDVKVEWVAFRSSIN